MLITIGFFSLVSNVHTRAGKGRVDVSDLFPSWLCSSLLIVPVFWVILLAKNQLAFVLNFNCVRNPAALRYHGVQQQNASCIFSRGVSWY